MPKTFYSSVYVYSICEHSMADATQPPVEDVVLNNYDDVYTLVQDGVFPRQTPTTARARTMTSIADMRLIQMES
ncbi:hypothetical protein ANCCAN_17223 [Ancylostoma caninum]|uniref:Uncharacterized protein n=1 Tax=Ancylostoma caninum TaxID=29170 RepID=A0A368G2S8_ANCCA|nr:hypothetical protein ANCCAN_17223 [Ancylostoma caninum]